MKEEVITSIKEILNLQTIAEILAAVTVTWLFVAGIRKTFDFLVDRFPRRRVPISSVFTVLRLIIWIGSVGFIISGIIKPQLNTLVAISATVGVAFGMGAQELIKNVLAGIFILMDQPFRVGDMITVGDHYGEVTQIGLTTSRMHTFDDSTITFPNGMLLSRAVINSNFGSLYEQVVIEVVLPGNVPVSGIRALMQEAALCSPYVYRKKPVVVLVEDRFDHGFLSVFKIKAYVLDVRFERLMASDITERIKECVAERNMLPRNILMSGSAS